MVGWHHWLNGHEFEQALGVCDGQGRLACCSPWGHEELDTTERLHWLIFLQIWKLDCELWQMNSYDATLRCSAWACLFGSLSTHGPSDSDNQNVEDLIIFSSVNSFSWLKIVTGLLAVIISKDLCKPVSCLSITILLDIFIACPLNTFDLLLKCFLSIMTFQTTS